ACVLTLGVSPIQAKMGPKTNNLNITPTVTSLSVENGQLVASGIATVIVKGQTYTSPFTAPVSIGLAADQPIAAAVTCPILDLSLGPIHLDLLGLVVDTSQICLQITANQGGGLLGDLLCSVANLLQGGLTLDQILAGQGLVDPVSGAVLIPGINVGDLL